MSSLVQDAREDVAVNLNVMSRKAAKHCTVHSSLEVDGLQQNFWFHSFMQRTRIRSYHGQCH